jgi:hypothetical protein
MADNGIRYLANTRIRDESASLQKELMEVELEIAAIKNTIYGLSVICGHELISRELLDQVRPVHRGKKPGLTAACRSVLASAVCQLINAADPSLLARQRNPLASVMTVLRNLAKKGEVVRKSAANGRSMWEWVALGRETQR